MNAVADTSMRGAIQTPTLLLMHLLAGKSILTLKSHRTGDRMTFRFSRPDEERANEYAMRRGTMAAATRGRPIWVSLYGGPEGDFTNEGNERRNWKMVATIWAGVGDLGEVTFAKSRKSPLPDDHVAVRTVAWIAAKLRSPEVLMEQAEWWHEGVCGRCGRRLTVPESIETGFGPECRKSVGLERSDSGCRACQRCYPENCPDHGGPQ